MRVLLGGSLLVVMLGSAAAVQSPETPKQPEINPFEKLELLGAPRNPPRVRFKPLPKSSISPDWMAEDAAYIATQEDRIAWRGLGGRTERSRFVRQFWDRFETLSPALCELHYRRILYANEVFSSHLDGWKTDRGKALVLFGRPDLVEDSRDIGAAERSMGNGFPFQIWHYRTAGQGPDITMEFVDPSMSDDYRFVDNKSPLPPVARGLLELRSWQTVPERPASNLVRQPLVTHLHQEVRASARYRIYFFKATKATTVAAIAITPPAHRGGRMCTHVWTPGETQPQIYGESSCSGNTVWQILPVAPGRHRLRAFVLDGSESTATLNTVVDVPAFLGQGLSASSLVLATSLRTCPPQEAESSVQIGSTCLQPNVSASFKRGNPLALYLQVYEPWATGLPRPQMQVRYTILQGQRVVFSSEDSLRKDTATITVRHLLPTDGLKRGPYRVRVGVLDPSTNRSVAKEAPFTIR